MNESAAAGVLVVQPEERPEVLLGADGDQGTVRRLVAREDGSSVLLGTFWLDVGQRNVFSLPSARGTAEETYYLMAGALRINWGGGVLEAQAGDAIFFPPGHQYVVETVGAAPVEVIWTAYPAPRRT